MRDVAHVDECPIDALEVYRKAAQEVIEAARIKQTVSSVQSFAYGAKLHADLGQRVQQGIHLLNLNAQGFKGFLGQQTDGVRGAQWSGR